jgi:hypothetical protein
MADYPCRLRNATTRPVEIHRRGEVEVLSPGQFLEAAEADPALQQLERAGVLTRHAPEGSAQAGTPKAGAEAATTTQMQELPRTAAAEREAPAVRKKTAQRARRKAGSKGSSHEATGGSA